MDGLGTLRASVAPPRASEAGAGPAPEVVVGGGAGVGEVIANYLWQLRHHRVERPAVDDADDDGGGGGGAGAFAALAGMGAGVGGLMAPRHAFNGERRGGEPSGDLDDALDERFGASGYLDVTLRVDDFNPWEGPVDDSGGASGGAGAFRGGVRGLSKRSEEEQLRAQRHRCPGCGAELSASLFQRNYAPCR